MRNNKKHIVKIRAACKEAKTLLTSVFQTEICIENLVDDDDFTYELTRVEFERICEPIFSRCLPCV